mgnify:CR=1 FL=1
MDAKIASLLKGNCGSFVFPFLWMHGEDEEKIREYVRVIHNASLKEFCVESRPHPDFAGDGWWNDMDIVLDAAKKLQMRVWILDDSHFPTGFANGALKECDPSLCRQSLVRRVIPCDKEKITLSRFDYETAPAFQPNMFEQFSLPQEHLRKFDDDQFLVAVALKEGGNSLDDIKELTADKNGDIQFKVPAGKWNIHLLYLSRNFGPHRDYINMMNPESCRLLIDAVYEPHYVHYKEEFGKTIAGFFSDEPELGNGHLYEYGKKLFEMDDQAWSAQLQEKLQAKWGKDFAKYLPLLWEENFASEIKAKARHDYMDGVSRLVQKAFSEQLGTWCNERGVQYIGHLIEDNNQHTRTGSGLGHFFRGESGQDMAGIDDIGGQVLPQMEESGPFGLTQEWRNGSFYHYVLGKLVSSAAAIDKKKQGRAMCEIFGNYGWEEGLRLEKYLLDHFLVRGINRFVPHAFSPKEYPDPDCPPHFYANGNNPQYRHFGALMAYANRMCELFDGGKRITPVAVLYHAESEWLGDYTPPEDTVKYLAESQIDYDFLPADVFTEEKYAAKIAKTLTVNGNEYRAFVIPKAQYIPQSVAKVAGELAQKGCTVLFIDELPQGVYDGEKILPFEESGKVVSTNELVKALDGVIDIRISPANKYLRVMQYKGESMRYLIVNEGAEVWHGKVKFPEAGTCYCYDGWENAVSAVNFENGEIELTVEPLKSEVLVFDKAKVIPAVTPAFAEIFLDDGWKRSKCRSIDYPNFADEKEVCLPDKAAEEYPKFSGFFRYEKEIELEGNTRFQLNITDAYEGVEVFVNGKSLGIQIAPPFVYEITDKIKKGKNAIRIEVATTLERETADLPDPTRMYLGLGAKQPTCPSGINGQVILLKREIK